MPMGLTTLGASMISVFIVATVVALFLEIMCVLFQRRRKLGGRVRVEPQESSALACVPCASMKYGYYVVKDVGRNDLAALIDSSQEVAKKSLEKAAECVRCLEEDMAKARERVELQEFSLGSCPPSVGLQGMRWSTIGDQVLIQTQMKMSIFLVFYNFYLRCYCRKNMKFGFDATLRNCNALWIMKLILCKWIPA
ncbi:hypothetical protein AHAS_Ahas06G0197500 [Arachis hypogaea]